MDICDVSAQLFHLVPVTPVIRLAARRGVRERQSFGRLLQEVGEQDARSCDRNEKGCGLVQPVHRRLREVPPLFAVMLSWESRSAAAADIRSLLAAVDTTLRVRCVPGLGLRVALARTEPHARAHRTTFPRHVSVSDGAVMTWVCVISLPHLQVQDIFTEVERDSPIGAACHNLTSMVRCRVGPTATDITAPEHFEAMAFH